MRNLLTIFSIVCLSACSQSKQHEIVSVTDAINYYNDSNNNCRISDSKECVKSKTILYDYVRGLISIKTIHLIITEATTDSKYGNDGYLHCDSIQSNPYCIAIDRFLKENDPTKKIDAADIAFIYNLDKSQKEKELRQANNEQQAEAILSKAKVDSN